MKFLMIYFQVLRSNSNKSLERSLLQMYIYTRTINLICESQKLRHNVGRQVLCQNERIFGMFNMNSSEKVLELCRMRRETMHKRMYIEQKLCENKKKKRRTRKTFCVHLNLYVHFCQRHKFNMCVYSCEKVYVHICTWLARMGGERFAGEGDQGRREERE